MSNEPWGTIDGVPVFNGDKVPLSDFYKTSTSIGVGHQIKEKSMSQDPVDGGFSSESREEKRVDSTTPDQVVSESPETPEETPEPSEPSEPSEPVETHTATTEPVSE